MTSPPKSIAPKIDSRTINVAPTTMTGLVAMSSGLQIAPSSAMQRHQVDGPIPLLLFLGRRENLTRKVSLQSCLLMNPAIGCL